MWIGRIEKEKHCFAHKKEFSFQMNGKKAKREKRKEKPENNKEKLRTKIQALCKSLRKLQFLNIYPKCTFGWLSQLIFSAW